MLDTNFLGEFYLGYGKSNISITFYFNRQICTKNYQFCIEHINVILIRYNS